MAEGFNLFKDVKDIFQGIKKGATLAKQLGMLDEKKESQGFMAKGPDFNFDSRLQSARPALQTMDQPRGMRLPNMQAMYTYFNNNMAKDVNIQQIQMTRVASAKPVGKSVNLGGMTSTRKTLVDKNLFRQRALG